MDASLSIQGAGVSKTKPPRFTQSFFKKRGINSVKAILPVAILSFFFPEMAVAAGGSGQDLMASGDATVGKTFGSDSSVVKWVVLAEVLVGGIMYMMTKNVKFLAGFAILSVFIAIGMSVAGY